MKESTSSPNTPTNEALLEEPILFTSSAGIVITKSGLWSHVKGNLIMNVGEGFNTLVKLFLTVESDRPVSVGCLRINQWGVKPNRLTADYLLMRGDEIWVTMTEYASYLKGV